MSDNETKILLIGEAMRAADLPPKFILDLQVLARSSNAIVRLMDLWHEESDPEEKDAIIADLQEHMDDTAFFKKERETPTERPKVPFDDFDGVLSSVSKFKVRLKKTIEDHGGVSEVARAAGIPQPSLSRLLNDGSMPRKATLLKIAKALDLSEKEIVSEWTRD